MGAQPGSPGGGHGRTGRHRRTGQALIARRDHTGDDHTGDGHADGDRPRRLALPAPSPSALVGIAVLVLIAVGVIHLSGAGSAVPLTTEAVTGQETTVAQNAENAEKGENAENTENPENGENPGGSGGGASDGGDGPAHVTAPHSTAAPDGPAAESSSPAELVVHVSGAVASPGVVRLPAGSRVDDALRAAGGPDEDAELSAVNLARPVDDGEQIYVPRPGEEPPASARHPGGTGSAESAAGGASGSGAGDGAGDSGAPIDLNSADATELEALPGVGPAIAQRIVEHREKNGPFASVDALLEVSGIGPATLEEIRGQATV
ncbi:MAG: ComEA family DNA-binding protein [Brachybacterium sp.]|uniref:ComEA family DNA-binding protein n=1 Tax=Brachybacterium sp. TaxID=1891286 RepID=UPI002648450F|nr:ComEA family DNA-binding protein [Brachybacterium sp.]MDN5688121.1 ComEA family DNA-binding protein [Brachybacterium sp.]